MENRMPGWLAQAPLPGLIILGYAEWGSSTPRYRDGLYQHLASCDPNWDSHAPHAQREFSPRLWCGNLISISHARPWGGYATAPSEACGGLGFDVEERQRIRPAVLRRIMNAHDDLLPSAGAATKLAKDHIDPLDAADPPVKTHYVNAWVWPAKESAFKALAGFEQPEVFADIAIRQTAFDDTLASYHFEFAVRRTHPSGTTSKGRGLVECRGDLFFAVSWIPR